MLRKDIGSENTKNVDVIYGSPFCRFRPFNQIGANSVSEAAAVLQQARTARRINRLLAFTTATLFVTLWTV